MEIQIPFREIILSILSVKTQLYKHFNTHEEYQPILNHLMNKDFLEDDNLKLPSIKSIEQATGIKYYQVRKRLNTLYESMFKEEDALVLDFNKIEYIFFAKHYKAQTFKVKNLKHLPKVGDNIDLPFLRGKLKTDSFYVDSIMHKFLGETQIIYIFLTSGHSNPYWKIRKAEAEMKGELSFNDIINLSDFELKRKLGLW